MPKYNKPPIEEAVIEIRFQKPFSIKNVAGVKKRIGKRYAKTEDLNNFEFKVIVNAAKAENILKPKSTGAKFISDDATDYFIFNETNAVTSNVAPYVGWDNFSKRAMEDVADVLQILPTNNVCRAGIRFVNRLDIPDGGEGKVDVKEYLSIFPNVPSDLCPVISQTSTFVVFKIPSTEWTCRLITATVDSPLIGHISIKLDIDVFLDKELEANVAKIKSELDLGRELKNKIFEQLVTDKARELFR